MLSALLLVFALPIATAALAHFLQLTFQKGMIFRWYYALISYWFKFKPRAYTYYFNSAYDEQVIWSFRSHTDKYLGEGRFVAYFKEAWYAWLYKPLGGCSRCHSTWIYIVWACLINLLKAYIGWADLFLIVLPLGAGMNYIYLVAHEVYILNKA